MFNNVLTYLVKEPFFIYKILRKLKDRPQLWSILPRDFNLTDFYI